MLAILSNLIKVYSICHSQQSGQGLHCLPFSAVWSGSTLFAILSSLRKVFTVIISSLIRVYTFCHSQEQSEQGLHYLPFSAVWSGTTLFAILSRLIKVKVYTVILRNSLNRVYTICHSQQSGQCLHYLRFSPVSSVSTPFAILSKQYYQGLLCFLFSAV